MRDGMLVLKKCANPECGEMKPMMAYPKCKKVKSGYAAQCKTCTAKAVRRSKEKRFQKKSMTSQEEITEAKNEAAIKQIQRATREALGY